MSGEIVERLKRATGADRELDAAIAVHVRHYVGHESGGNFRPPAYTKSLDATLALVEAKLPGANWSMSKGTEQYHALIDDDIVEPRAIGHAPTPAIALLIALFRALESSNAK